MTGMTRIASIVEGHGEVEGLPQLIRRVAQERCGAYVDAPRPHRIPRGNMVNRPADLRNAVRLQAARFVGPGGVLVLADLDDDDEADLKAELQRTVDEANPVRPVIVTLAVREYEAWFLAGIESLRAHRSVRDDAIFDGDPESPRNPKKPLEILMHESYGSVRHQVAFNTLLDLDTTIQRSPSFRHFVEAVESLVRE